LKSISLNAGNAVGYGYAGNVGAAGKSAVVDPAVAGYNDGFDRCRYRIIIISAAEYIAERPICDRGPAGRAHKRYGYARQAGAAVKSVCPNAGNAVGYGYAGNVGAAGKSVFGDTAATGYNDGFQRCRNGRILTARICRSEYITKMGICGSGQRIAHKWYGYAGQAGAAAKSVSPNAGNFAGGVKGYAGKCTAISKTAIPNAGNIVEIARKYSC